MDMEIQVLLYRLEPDHVADVVQHGAELVRSLHQFHFAGFDLGEIQQVVDQGQK